MTNDEKTVDPEKVSKEEEEEDVEKGDDESEDETVSGVGEAAAGASKKKKKKNRKKKKPAGGALPVNKLPEQDNSRFRCLGNWPLLEATQQTFPPTVPPDDIYKDGKFPKGEEVAYRGSNGYRISSSEKQGYESLFEEDYQNIRRSAEVHRQVRKYAQSYINPGVKLIDVVQKLEAKSKELLKANKLESGWGFPTGVSVNNCAAHYTPNYGDNRVIEPLDVVKVDFGTHVAGRIVDSAFTVAFDPRYDEIIQASKDGTNAGLREAGIDARFSEIGSAIQEAIESHEYVDQRGNAVSIKPVRNLNGHSIGLYQVHGGKSVPIIKNNETTVMEEGEMYAIETFASTGKGMVQEVDDCSHYMRNKDCEHVPLRMKAARELLKGIDENFGTLAFCRRWLDDLGYDRHLMALRSLVQAELVRDYPPLNDKSDSIVTQMEHTVLLRPTCKEIVSRGDDY